MAFLKFLLFFILGLFVIRLVWMLTWPYVTRWLMKRVAKSLQEQMRRQQNAQQQNYRQFEQEIRFDEQMSARVKPQSQRTGAPRKDWSSAAEDVDFEELK